MHRNPETNYALQKPAHCYWCNYGAGRSYAYPLSSDCHQQHRHRLPMANRSFPTRRQYQAHGKIVLPEASNFSTSVCAEHCIYRSRFELKVKNAGSRTPSLLAQEGELHQGYKERWVRALSGLLLLWGKTPGGLNATARQDDTPPVYPR